MRPCQQVMGSGGDVRECQGSFKDLQQVLHVWIVMGSRHGGYK